MTQLSPTLAATGHAKPPSLFDRIIDRATRGLAQTFAAAVVLLLVYLVWTIGQTAVPAAREHGMTLITSSDWDPDNNHFGLRAPILGTLYSSILALIIATVFGLAIAIFLSQNFLPRKLEILFKNIVELLAAIPSVVYGFWGIFVIIPLLRPVCEFLGAHLGFIPLFHGSLSTGGTLPAAIVLAVMVLPTISAISYDALSSVHPRLKEGAVGLGATRWETILKVILPTASAGVFGSIILGLGRALGETMALAMLLGNRNDFSISLFDPGNTLAALIANSYSEAVSQPHKVQPLLFAGMLLLAITLVVNVAGTLIIQYANRGKKGAVQ